MGKFHDFGRRIFLYYQKYPLSMNSLAGATVYGIGEVVVQSYSDKQTNLDWKRVAGITALGSVGKII